MSKQRILLIIGIVLSLISIVMVKVYIDQQVIARDEARKKALSQQLANSTSILVAKKDIVKGTVINVDMLESVVVPNQYLQPQVVTSLDRIADMITVADISKGEQITLTKLSKPKEAGVSGLAEATPVGKRAITISVDNIAALAGMVKAGDCVDVIAMVPIPVQTQEGKQVSQAAVLPLFQNVLVLAVGQETSATRQENRYKKEEKKEISPLITLALSPQDASLIAFVQEQGKIKLALRSPADSQVETVQPANWDSLLQYIMSKIEPSKPEKKKEEPPVEGYVEIYRGLNKEEVPIYK